VAVEFYPTPQSAVLPLVREMRRLAPHLEPSRPWRVFDPGCGDGALGAACRGVEPNTQLVGAELDEELAKNAAARGYAHVSVGDFLELPSIYKARGFPAPDLIICNPPFTLWTQFVNRIFDEWRGRETYVAVLGRLGMLGAQWRREWWRDVCFDYGRPALRVLSKRPSFTGDGRTDGTDYAWYVWNMDHESEFMLDWYGGDE
jgi:hypothetical protein